MSRLYHIARRQDWLAAQATGSYAISTLGKTLGDVGFIHLSFAHQVKMVADYIYSNTADLVLLKIDPEKLIAEVKIENVDGTTERFPHLYGPLNIEAVTKVEEFKVTKDNTYPSIAD